MASNYEVGRFLGKGSFASVHLARDIRTKRHYAIKIVDVTECQQQQQQEESGGRVNDELNPLLHKSKTKNNSILHLLQQEIDVQSSVSSHPNIVSLLESFSYSNEITGNEMKAILLEYCPWGDLQGYFKSVRTNKKQQQEERNGGNGDRNFQGGRREETLFLPTHEIRHALSQILCGVSYLHSRGVVHRDIKAPNILLCPLIQSSTTTTTKKKVGSDGTPFTLLDCQLKIGDFGLAVQMQEDEDWYEAQHTICGTPSCLAPEVVRQFLPLATTETMTKQPSVAKVSKLHGLDNTSFFTEQQQHQHIISEQHVGYGQPADLWSAGCLLYTMIVGRNPFALPIPSRTTTNLGAGSAVTLFLEKRQQIQQIVERVIRGDWSVPSHISIENVSLEMLLEQLLESTPRKRGTARGILNLHPFFQSATATSAVTTSTASPSVARRNNSEVIGITSNKECACRNVTSLPSSNQTNELHFANATIISISSAYRRGKENVCNMYPLMSGAKKQHLTDISHPSVSEDDASLWTTTSEEVSPRCKKLTHRTCERRSLSRWDNDQQPLARERPQDGSVTSLRRVSVSSESFENIERELDMNKNSSSMAIKPCIDNQSLHIPFVSMKALQRLPQAKYKWTEPQRKGTTIKEHKIYFLGNEGIVIQQESNIDGLWMHVTSDGLGILWGKLQPNSNRSTQFATPTDRPTPLNAEPSSLYMEAFSRAPISFSKHSLSSLLTLQCREIISLYESLEHVVHRVKLQTPKITVLLFSTNQEQKSPVSDYCAKTTLMENDPVGDIQTEFGDGTIIRLSSADGIIIVKEKNDRSTSLAVDPNRFFAELRADRPRSPCCRRGEVPQSFLTPSQLFVHHLCIFIESARECLLIESRHSGSDAYPVVRKLKMLGWNHDQWIVEGATAAIA